MSSGPQDLIKEILARLAASPDEARQQLLRDAIAVNGSELGPEGVEQLRKLAGFVDQANEVFPDEDLVEQNIRAGNYRIEGLIASGGMADVYKAVEPPPSNAKSPSRSSGVDCCPNRRSNGSASNATA